MTMTRWTKLSRDIWSNRSRSLLVILSITVGVFAVGMISLTRQALTRSLHEQYLAIHPAEAIIQTLPGMDDDLVSAIRHTKGVTDAEGRRSLPLRLSQDGAGETWRDLTLYSLADYRDQHLFTIHLEDGSWPPKKGEVLMERASMAFLGLKTGDTILIKTASGKKARLEVRGTVLDLYREPPLLDGWLYGYVSQETIRWLGEPEGYNELYLDTAGEDRPTVNRIVERVSDRLKGESLPVYKKTVINQNSHPLEYIIDTIVLLLGLVAVLSMGLSALLVINIISALIAQQESHRRQIGPDHWHVRLSGGFARVGGGDSGAASQLCGRTLPGGFRGRIDEFRSAGDPFLGGGPVHPTGGGPAGAAAGRSPIHSDRDTRLTGEGAERVRPERSLVRRKLARCHSAALPAAHPYPTAGAAESIPKTRAVNPLAGHADLCRSRFHGQHQPAGFPE
jgi:hypothetical protein